MTKLIGGIFYLIGLVGMALMALIAMVIVCIVAGAIIVGIPILLLFGLSWCLFISGESLFERKNEEEKKTTVNPW